MSSTNKTNYYDLSQYIGTDKPTYLGDYNSDMTKIDAGIHSADDKATTATQNAGSAIARVGEVEKTVKSHTTAITDLQTDIVGLKDKVKTAQDTATTANQNATGAQNTADSALLTANNANAKADRVNRDTTLWTGSIKNSTITLNDSLSNYRFLYVETAEGVGPIFAYRTDKKNYDACQQGSYGDGAITTTSIKITVVDDTHITINSSAMQHAYTSTHPGNNPTAVIGVYGIPR